MSKASFGDFGSKPIIHYRTKLVLEKYYEYIGNLETIDSIELQIYKLDNDYHINYIAGIHTELDNEEKFAVFLDIEFSKKPNMLGYTNILNVDLVTVTYSKRGISFAKSFYLYMVKQLGYTIIGDSLQYFGARKLWTRLSKLDGVSVHIINYDTKQFIEKDVELYHGNEDHEFDERVWSYDNSKKHVRLILENKPLLIDTNIV